MDLGETRTRGPNDRLKAPRKKPMGGKRGRER